MKDIEYLNEYKKYPLVNFDIGRKTITKNNSELKTYYMEFLREFKNSKDKIDEKIRFFEFYNIMKEAHKIKGSCSYFGCKQLQEISSSIILESNLAINLLDEIDKKECMNEIKNLYFLLCVNYIELEKKCEEL